MARRNSRMQARPLKDMDSVRRAGYDLIAQLLAQNFKVFLASVGAHKVLSAYQPMGEYSGHAIARNFIERLNIKGDEGDSIAIPIYAFTNNILNCSCDPVEIRERGVEMRVTSCYMAKAGAPPEYCAAISHNACVGVAKEMNPEFEIIYTHHLTQGDPYCRYVVKRRSDKIGDISDLGNIVKVLPPIDLPESEKLALTTSYSCSIWVNSIRAMLEVLGSKDALAILSVPSRVKGEEFGKEAKDKLGIETGDARDAQSIIEALGSVLIQSHQRLDDGPDLVRTEVKGCVLEDGPSEACFQFEMLANGICKAIHPSLEMAHERMRTKGDDTCRWVVRRSRDWSKEESNDKRPLDDPVKRLTNKFIDGEITEEEFDKRLAHLRKHGIVR